MNTHAFILTPGKWRGEGGVTLTGSDELIHYYTQWDIEEIDEKGTILCKQKVQIQGTEGLTTNLFRLTEITDKGFRMHLRNELVQAAEGKGVIEPGYIGWEFRTAPKIEGFEIYHPTKEDEYALRAEYVATDQFRTSIEGRIWRVP